MDPIDCARIQGHEEVVRFLSSLPEQIEREREREKMLEWIRGIGEEREEKERGRGREGEGLEGGE